MSTVNAKKPRTREKDRMHVRLDPKIKGRIARAAAITGQGLTDFEVSTLSKKADEIFARHDTILLTSSDYNFLLKDLDENASRPNAHALQLSDTGVVVTRCEIPRLIF